MSNVDKRINIKAEVLGWPWWEETCFERLVVALQDEDGGFREAVSALLSEKWSGKNV